MAYPPFFNNPFSTSSAHGRGGHHGLTLHILTIHSLLFNLWKRVGMCAKGPCLYKPPSNYRRMQTRRKGRGAGSQQTRLHTAGKESTTTTRRTPTYGQDVMGQKPGIWMIYPVRYFIINHGNDLYGTNQCAQHSRGSKDRSQQLPRPKLCKSNSSDNKGGGRGQHTTHTLTSE